MGQSPGLQEERPSRRLKSKGSKGCARSPVPLLAARTGSLHTADGATRGKATRDFDPRRGSSNAHHKGLRKSGSHARRTILAGLTTTLTAPRAMDHHSSGCLPAEKFPTHRVSAAVFEGAWFCGSSLGVEGTTLV